MAERKKTYVNSSNKHAVREFLIQRFQFESVENVKAYWNNIFDQIKVSSGKYIIHDCFYRFIKTINSRPLADILNVHIATITSSIGRNTYLRTLKIQK